MRHSMQIVGLICGTAVSALVGAQPAGLVVNHWVCEMGSEQAIARSVAIGCDILDPILGCPPGDPLSLQLRFLAPPNSVARLTLSIVPPGLHPAVGARSGSAKRVDYSTIVMSPGSAVLTGFASNAAPAPIIKASINVPAAAFQVTPNPWLTGPESAGQVKLDITQVVGDYIADRTSIRHFYYPCGARTSMDRITLSMAPSSSGAVALIDARTDEGCVSYEGRRGVPFIELENLLTKGACRERVTAFANRNALAFRKESSFWGDEVGDDMPVELTAMAAQPVKVWVLYDRCRQPGAACSAAEQLEVTERPVRHLQNAIRVYRDGFSGITFKRTGGVDLSASPNAELRAIVDGNQLQCDQESIGITLQRLKEITRQRDDGDYSRQLNVFYVNNPGGWGVWCGKYDPYGIGRDTILIHARGSAGTVAHEIGHALLNSGRHANPGVDGFSDAHRGNLMGSGVQGEELTLGQLFRTSLSPGSPVNRHGARSGPKASCSAPAGSLDACPDLPLDVTPR